MNYQPGDVIRVLKLYQLMYELNPFYIVIGVDDSCVTVIAEVDDPDHIYFYMIDKRYGKKRN